MNRAMNRAINRTMLIATFVSLILLVAHEATSADETVLISEPVELKTDFPREVVYETKVDADWSELSKLRVTLWVPEDVPRGTKMLVYLKDAQWNWYQYDHPTMLKSGRPNVIIIDITARSTAWKPTGHERGWDGYVTQKIRTFGLKVFNLKPWKGTLRLQRVTCSAVPAKGLGLCLLDVRANASSVKRYDKFELSFDLSRTYENPFDPSQIDVTGTFTAPSGKSITVPGFYYRDFTRRRTGLGAEQLVPLGRSYWKIRFAPTELGTYAVSISARDGTGHVRTSPMRFRCVESSSEGFVRVDRKDPFFFSLDSGRFFYPVGQMLRSPTDLRVPYPYGFTQKRGEGTFAFDRYFSRLGDNGVNFIRTWMGNWWLGIEAPKTYAPGYEGLGKYNMENAWKLDYLLSQARRRGIYIELTLLNHGLFHRKVDSEWYENPYNVLNGGPLRHPSQFFTNPKAKAYFKRRLRYIVARWAHDTHLFSWEMWNEVDLVKPYSSGNSRAWHAEMIDYISKLDPYDHITTTHFCNQPMDPEVNSLPQIKFTQCDLYTGPIVTGVRSTWLSKKVLHKGAIISEYGKGHDLGSLEANFHGGLWTSTVLPMAGTAMFWWWPWVDAHDMYWHYKPVAIFNRGEDRRGRALKLTMPTVFDKDRREHKFLRAIGSQNGTSAYIWVYDEPIFECGDGARYRNPPTFAGTTMRMVGLERGTYTVEFFDTTTGKIVWTAKFTSDGTWMNVTVPEFRADIAIKVKK